MQRDKLYQILLMACSLACAASAASAQQSQSARASDDIVVTATRREEAIQKVAVSAQAFGSETLREQNITASSELQRLVPGVILSGGGSDVNTTFTIRGQGRDTIGPISPSVMSYVNDVPLPAWGAIIPTYDMANVQILKGPQGTLFGRNTTGGAVLTYSKQPTYQFGGYLQGLIGSYNWKEVEGAINVPLIQDKLALRVAGLGRGRDGYTKSGNGGQAADDLRSQAFRVSILFEPTSWIKNVTVYDYYKENAIQSLHPIDYVAETGPGGANATFRLFGPAFDCNTSPSCDVDLALQRQRDAGPRVGYANPGYPKNSHNIQGVSNTTTVDLGAVTVKNIVAFRSNRIFQLSDTDGTEMTIINVPVWTSDDQITEELQLSGDTLGNSLHWLVGGFYLQDEPGGPNALAYDLFRPAGVDPDTWFLDNVQNAAFANRSHAVFGSLSQDMSWLIPGLKINGSARYTWDSTKECGVTTVPFSGAPAADFKACTTVPGAFVASARFKKPTWSIGADYQAADNIFLYVVSRRGYRAGGLNAPRLGGTLAQYQTFAPQTVTDVEIGAKTDWTAGDWRARFNIAAYHGKFDDLQRPASGIPPNFDGDGDPLDDPANTSLDLNVGTAEINGVDIDGFVSPFAALRVNYGVSWFDGVKSAVPASLAGLGAPGKQFDNAPKWSYQVGLQYDFPFQLAGGDLSANVDWYWVDKYRVQYFPFPSRHVMNASVKLDNIGGRAGLSGQFFIQNLTDEVYFTNTSLSGLSPGILTATYAAPRMFGLRLRYEYN
jgi:iron complex outermembrane recepter protein